VILTAAFSIRLSELLYVPLPSLPTASQKSDSILIGTNQANNLGDESEDALLTSGGKWEDEEERKFFEDLPDLKDFVPRSVLGIEDEEREVDEETEKAEKARADEEARKLEEELEGLKLGGNDIRNGERLDNGHPIEGTDKELNNLEDE
jgi:regulator of nonsense transcripts 2